MKMFLIYLISVLYGEIKAGILFLNNFRSLLNIIILKIFSDQTYITSDGMTTELPEKEFSCAYRYGPYETCSNPGYYAVYYYYNYNQNCIVTKCLGI